MQGADENISNKSILLNRAHTLVDKEKENKFDDHDDDFNESIEILESPMSSTQVIKINYKNKAKNHKNLYDIGPSSAIVRKNTTQDILTEKNSKEDENESFEGDGTG